MILGNGFTDTRFEVRDGHKRSANRARRVFMPGSTAAPEWS